MLTGNPETQEHRCLDCHFLQKHGISGGGTKWTYATSRDERAQLANYGRLPEDGTKTSFACHRNVWDSANPAKDSCQDIREIINQERGESCFFYPYESGMFFDATEELERRAADRREAHRDRAWVRMGFWLAAVALFINLGWNCYVYHDSKASTKAQMEGTLDE